MIRRTPIRRRTRPPTGHAAGRKRPPRGPRRDPVTPGDYVAVRHRDGWGCVGALLGFGPGCAGRIELDHVRNGGMALRGPSTPDNLVSLCTAHHRFKTEHARAIRFVLIGYLEGGVG